MSSPRIAPPTKSRVLPSGNTIHAIIMPSHVQELAAMSSAMSFKSLIACSFVSLLTTPCPTLLHWLPQRLPARAA
jgi:hypothetical protein